jgi:hypothetical protein
MRLRGASLMQKWKQTAIFTLCFKMLPTLLAARICGQAVAWLLPSCCLMPASARVAGNRMSVCHRAAAWFPAR